MSGTFRLVLLILFVTLRIVPEAEAASTRGLVRRRRWPGGNARKPSAGSRPKPLEVIPLDPAKITPSNHTPDPGKLDLSTLDSTKLTPPRYCYYNLEGGLTQPSVKKPRGGPSQMLTKIIAERLAQPRPCMYYRRYCNQNLTENVDLKGDCCFGTR